jgi:UDP-glucose 6-dehydrogenase
VVTMNIGSCNVRRVLVVGGSSVNVIMARTLKEMGIGLDQIIPKSTVLVGFSGEAKDTLGEISLPTFAQSVPSFEKFAVMDCPSSYNVILGRPWIHNLRAIPSTYHQCVKIPAPWGVVTLRGDQQQSQECYKVTMKPTNLIKETSD